MEQISSGVIARVRDTGEEEHSDEAWEDPNYDDMKSVREMKMLSLLCCPVPGEDGSGTRGAIYIENRSRTGAFTHSFREAIRLLAGVMAQKLALLGNVTEFDLDRGASMRQGGWFAEYVGQGQSTARLLREVAGHLDHDLHGSPLLILGEVGVGKATLARCIHKYGSRSMGPYREVDAATLKPQSACRVLFGAASTRSRAKGREGIFHEARGGVLVLKNISRLPKAAQPALYEALSTGTVRRVGGAKAEAFDAWVVVTCSEDITAMMKKGKFDRPLYEELHRKVMRIAPLRERLDDIPPLARHFAAQATVEAADGGKAPYVSPDLLSELMHRPWPGNVPELRNLMYRLVGDAVVPMLTLDDLRRVEQGEGAERQGGRRGGRRGGGRKSGAGGTSRPKALTAVPKMDWKSAQEQSQRSYLTWAVETWGPSPVDVAEALGIQRTYLYSLCAKNGVPLGRAAEETTKKKAGKAKGRRRSRKKT